MVNHRGFIFFVFIIMVCHCSANESAYINPKATQSSPSNIDFEQQVRDMAEQTAAEEKIKKEQARLASQAGARQPFSVFKYKKNGAVVFSDSVPYKTPYQLIVYNSCYACSIKSNVNWQNTKLHLTEFADTIAHVSKIHKVDPAFVRAVIHAESAFNPLARSKKGAVGLMQLMPGTASDMGVRDSTDPIQNINGGVKYLAALLQNFNGNKTLAAAAYNAGSKAVTRHNGIPPYEETQTYVKRVNILLQRYKNQMVWASS